MKTKFNNYKYISHVYFIARREIVFVELLRSIYVIFARIIPHLLYKRLKRFTSTIYLWKSFCKILKIHNNRILNNAFIICVILRRRRNISANYARFSLKKIFIKFFADAGFAFSLDFN